MGSLRRWQMMRSKAAPSLVHGVSPANLTVWSAGSRTTSPLASIADASTPNFTSRPGVTYGTCRIRRYPPSTEISYPSSRRRFSEGLRLISCCDIEDHALLDLHGRSCAKRPLGFVAVATPAGDREDPVRSARNGVEGQCEEFLEG